MQAVLDSPHGTASDARTPAAKQQCESCHGDSAAHVENPLEVSTIRFGPGSKVAISRQNDVCLGCHEGGKQLDWVMDEHAAADVACISCHSIHVKEDRVLSIVTETAVCTQCHLEKRSDAYRRSRHPIREGLMSCSGCHNPHGSSGRAALNEPTVNETCFQCHAEKRGPYLYEHAPVAEDCTSCHMPHGSNQPYLLTQRAPYLCQECHNESFHPGSLYDGGDLPVGGTSTGAIGKLVAHGCMNCHQKIHGSNHPSGNVFSR